MLGTLAQHGDRLIILRELGPGAVQPSHRQQLRGCDLAGPLPGFPLHLRSLARDEFTHLFEIFLQSSLEFSSSVTASRRPRGMVATP